MNVKRLIMDAPLIVGKSAAIKNLLFFIKKTAKSDANVLILGETGVGKELAAKAIHYESSRRHKPLIKLNCGNLNENLVESELFGHRRGAFTGAFIDKFGLIEEASGGTFFFDEIGDIVPSLQAKMLSVVEDKEIRRVGENTRRKIDVRFIFATNKDLFRLVEKGKFRQDLFYRISILTVHIPPLRERREDIPLLIEDILGREYSRKSRNLSLTKEAVDKMCAYSYPGNIRELENMLKRACELSASDIINEDDMSFRQIPPKKAKTKGHKCKTGEIIEALVECGGNKTKAAKQLGISRVHLYRILNYERTDPDLQ